MEGAEGGLEDGMDKEDDELELTAFNGPILTVERALFPGDGVSEDLVFGYTI